jgi:uncharacterized protein
LSGPVRDRGAMLAGMAPVLNPGRYRFATLADGEAVPAGAVGWFREAEGLSLIVPADAGGGLPLRWITLSVHSALDGVGLTAAVSGVLADAGIACNMVAAHFHDHLFVPEADAGRAMAVLTALQQASS